MPDTALATAVNGGDSVPPAAVPSPAGGGRHERVTVNLTPNAAAAPARAAATTGDSKTDVVNRAVQVYALLTAEVRAGGHVLVRHADGDQERYRLFTEPHAAPPGLSR
jgi:hypothetical protein